MTPEEQERLHACTQEIAEILYRNSDKTKLKTSEGIEQTVRQQMLEHVSPKVALFLSTVKFQRTAIPRLSSARAKAGGDTPTPARPSCPIELEAVGDVSDLPAQFL